MVSLGWVCDLEVNSPTFPGPQVSITDMILDQLVVLICAEGAVGDERSRWCSPMDGSEKVLVVPVENYKATIGFKEKTGLVGDWGLQIRPTGAGVQSEGIQSSAILYRSESVVEEFVQAAEQRQPCLAAEDLGLCSSLESLWGSILHSCV